MTDKEIAERTVLSDYPRAVADRQEDVYQIGQKAIYQKGAYIIWKDELKMHDQELGTGATVEEAWEHAGKKVFTEGRWEDAGDRLVRNLPFGQVQLRFTDDEVAYHVLVVESNGPLIFDTKRTLDEAKVYAWVCFKGVLRNRSIAGEAKQDMDG